MSYRYLAASPQAFIQQLAVAYVARGYFFYVAGHIPPGKDLELIDAKLLDRYQIRQSRWQRARRKLLGKANVHYLRFGSFFVLLASKGAHEFFDAEADVIRDVRREPIAFAGYSVGYGQGVDGRGHVSVRIHRNEYRWLKSYMCQFARHATAEEVAEEFRRLRFEPYAPVVRQLFSVLRAVNRVRKVAGLRQIEPDVIRTRRRVVRAFEPGVRSRAA